ncbi:MAG: putative sulfate exporter family transporter [Desulfovibrionaceae bacterium]|nr:putative sulfate exporter family transporter [Desulfovibrionaceae bacterium]
MANQHVFNEDKVACVLGGFVFLLGLCKFAGLDLVGWILKMGMWVDDPMVCFKAATKGYMEGWQALLATYVFVTLGLSVGIKMMKGNPIKFIGAFTVIFFIAVACYVCGANAYIAANPTQLAKQGIPWALGLSTEAGLILALIVGIILGNFAPGFVEKLQECGACRPELFVKIAIVILGVELGVKAADAAAFAGVVIFRGLCAIVEAYLLYWAVVYYVARKYFKFNKEWAAPLASGISICGVSAAIATGGAIRARPVVPIMVSSLVVVFTCIEMLILPFIASAVLHNEPMVAGGWMGLAVKSDGGAIASGAITESLILTKAAALGTNWETGWITMVTTTVKVFIDMFIGVWSFILAYIWTKYFDAEAKEGKKMSWGDVWDRFPRFVLGYVITFLIMLTICISSPDMHKVAKSISGALNGLRVMFFLLTFFSIGLVSNFKKLLEEGIGRLAIVYVVCLFGFIIWVGLFISYLFFHGMTPPLAQAAAAAAGM